MRVGCARVDGAFVTGGSGFIGGRLIERLVGRRRARSGRSRAPTRSADKVRALGAEPVRGDLDDAGALRRGRARLRGRLPRRRARRGLGRPEGLPAHQRARHAAASSARRAQAGARRVVHVGTEAALLEGQPLVAVDESEPLRPRLARALLRDEGARRDRGADRRRRGIETRRRPPALRLGPGDTTLLPAIVEQVRERAVRVGRRRHATCTETTHVDNTVEGLVLAATRGRDRGVYFVTDGAPIVVPRHRHATCSRTQGLEPRRPVVPRPGRARAGRGAARRCGALLPLPGSPPLTRFALVDRLARVHARRSRARRELGYEPVITREQGLEELRAS